MRKRDAFILVELLVVIVIMGILAAVVVAVVPSATGRAKQSALASTLATLQLAPDRFYVETNLYLAQVQPDDTKAVKFDYEAVDGNGKAFVGGYLQYEPNKNPVDLGLPAGCDALYGVTANGRVFDTQAADTNGAWTDGSITVYTQDKAGGTTPAEIGGPAAP